MNETRLIAVLIAGLLICCLWMRLNKAIYRDLFSPFSLLFWFWIVPILLRGMNLSWAESDWSPSAMFALALVTAEMALISLLPLIFGKKIASFADKRQDFDKIVATLKGATASMWLPLTFLTLLIGSIYIDFLSNPGGFLLYSALSGNLSQSDASYYGWGKTLGRTPLISVMLTFVWLLPALSSLYYVKFKISAGVIKKSFCLLAALTPMILGIIKLSKTDTMIGFLSFALAAYYVRKFVLPPPQSFWKTVSARSLIIIGILVVVLIMFYSTAVFRVGENDVETSSMLGWTEFKFTDPSMFNVLASYVYAYSAFNFENFARFMDSYDGGMHLGISFFRPILSALMQGDVAETMLRHIDFHTITSGLIAGTYLSDIYAEMGWLGLIVAPITYALLVNILYWRFRRNPTIGSCLLYFNFVFCWTFMFFANAFATLLFYTNAILIWLLWSFLRKIQEQYHLSNPTNTGQN